MVMVLQILVLLAAFGSTSLVTAETQFCRVAGLPTVVEITGMRIVATLPFSKIPILQVSVVLPVHVPELGVALSVLQRTPALYGAALYGAMLPPVYSATLAGKLSVTVVTWLLPGPLLVTVMSQ